MWKKFFIISSLALLAVFVFLVVYGLQDKNINNNSVNENIENSEDTKDKKPHPVSLPALMEKEYNGHSLELGKVLAQNEAYTRYYITYKSGELIISGIMNAPKGNGPFPVLFLNHGYIDPDVYTNGRGLKREQDYLARRGYVVIHSDYRNHADSDKDPENGLNFRLGYTEDIINAIIAVKESSLTIFDKDKIGMLGHSMGGGIALNTMVIKPELVKASVLFAPVSSDHMYNYEKWIKNSEIAEKIIEAYGTYDENPEFWENLSARNFFENIKAPIMLHHGTSDDSVPIEWSDETAAALKEANKEITYFIYENEPHEFINAWPLVMKRTTDFFNAHLK